MLRQAQYSQEGPGDPGNIHDGLALCADVKARLKTLTPATYSGIAARAGSGNLTEEHRQGIGKKEGQYRKS